MRKIVFKTVIIDFNEEHTIEINEIQNTHYINEQDFKSLRLLKREFGLFMNLRDHIENGLEVLRVVKIEYPRLETDELKESSLSQIKKFLQGIETKIFNKLNRSLVEELNIDQRVIHLDLKDILEDIIEKENLNSKLSQLIEDIYKHEHKIDKTIA